MRSHGTKVAKKRGSTCVALDRSAKRWDLVRSGTEQFIGVGYILRGILGSNATKKQEHEHHRASNHDELAQGRAGLAQFRPLAASIAGISQERLRSKLVVNHTAKGDAVAKELKPADLSSPDKHRGNDEQHILEDTAKRQNQGRGPANLQETH